MLIYVFFIKTNQNPTILIVKLWMMLFNWFKGISKSILTSINNKPIILIFKIKRNFIKFILILKTNQLKNTPYFFQERVVLSKWKVVMDFCSMAMRTSFVLKEIRKRKKFLIKWQAIFSHIRKTNLRKFHKTLSNLLKLVRFRWRPMKLIHKNQEQVA